jgi:uncharacterized membrane protein YuzA (DUF378 family)
VLLQNLDSRTTPAKGELTMRAIDLLATVLVVVGGINWGLVALAKFDLVAFITGQTFGEVNLLSGSVYALVAIAALWIGARAVSGNRGLVAA